MGRRILITGSSGYLAGVLLEACKRHPEIEWLGGIDVRPPASTDGWHFYPVDVRTGSGRISELIEENRVDTLVHLAWIFNPTHDQQLEYEVDVLGSNQVLKAAISAKVPYLIYLSSTTSYGPHSDNPEIFDESYPRRGHRGYLYSKYKAEVDHLMVDFVEKHSETRTLLLRVSIVLGQHTRNVVTQMTELPLMFGVAGYDPPMQFVHEEDVQRLLIWAVNEQPVGIFNIGGIGTIRYSDLIRKLKKKAMWLPSWLIYPAVGALWKLRLVPFPPSILDFIRYPWVGSTKKFEETYDFQIRHTSEEAFLAYARARWPKRNL